MYTEVQNVNIIFNVIIIIVKCLFIYVLFKLENGRPFLPHIREKNMLW